ncbi:MAG TPA: alanine racemase [Steroidobacteraceae bacterium]|jgi:D-serine deaminase-like pyridoxal phosphate-dependent protein|nr:alanine racemase [Steroidobacteraceae bacterium]
MDDTTDLRPNRWTRRRMLLSGAAIAAAATVFALRKGDHGGRHNAYFLALSRALREAGIARPVLVIDRARLHANMQALRRTLAGSNLATRIVVKSLPARKLIEEIAQGLSADRFMVFNGPMVLDMARVRPASDMLLGKPLPALEVGAVCDQLAAQGFSGLRPQWLVDTPQRIQEYAQIARARAQVMRVNAEIDVGLHRGGFQSAEDLAAALDLIKQSPDIEFSGLMGYDPHVPKMPSPGRAYEAVIKRYRESVEVVRSRMGPDTSKLTFNTAGSPTYSLHARDPVATEVAVGSAFVKPRDFDTRTLEDHIPAAFIATPVIKAVGETRIPGLESLSGVLQFFDANSARAFFIHGGHWLAAPESPPGLEFNALYGRSSNQEILTGSSSVVLKPDDYVFFRPNQSEALFLQFADLLVYEDGKIADRWATFPISA